MSWNRSSDSWHQEIDNLQEKLRSAQNQARNSQKALNEMQLLKDNEDNAVPDLVAKLRVSLQEVQQDADEFRNDLARLKEDKQASEEAHRREVIHLQECLKKEMGSSRSRGSKQDRDLQLHKDECRGLLVQINYLQAKWHRETTFRSDLQFTKRYLLSLFGASQ